MIEAINESNIEFYRSFFFKGEIEEGMIAYGEAINDIACGAIISERSEKDEETWEIKLLYVMPLWRREGIGRRLLEKLLGEIKQRGYKRIKYTAVTSKQSIEQLEGLLSQYGFSKAEIVCTIYRFETETLRGSEFVTTAQEKELKPIGGMKITTLDEMDKEVLRKLKEKEGIDYPDNLSPFAQKKGLTVAYPLFAIAPNGEVAGWITSLESPGDIILYRSAFVVDKYRKTGIGYFLYITCIREHALKYVDKDILVGVDVHNERMNKILALFFKNSYKYKKYEFVTTLNMEERGGQRVE